MLDFILHTPYAQAQFLIIFATVSVAYVIFGIAGFGTALVAGPVLLHYMPLSQVIPLLVLLDCVAAFGRLARSYKNVVHAEGCERPYPQPKRHWVHSCHNWGQR